MLSPHGGQRAEATGGLDVADDANDHDRRSLEDGDGLDGLLLVLLGARLVHVTDDVGHAGLVAHEGGEVAGLGSIIARKLPHSSPVVGAPLARAETKGTVTRALWKGRQRGRQGVQTCRYKNRHTSSMARVFATLIL
eukprot:764612-Hanusia_phi.AAC.3